MKVTFETAKEIDLRIFIKIKKADNLYDMELRNPSKQFTVPKLANLTVSVDSVAVVGRRPEEVEYFIVQYNEMEFKVAPVINTHTGELEPIVIIDGSKDYWTNVLRQKAMEIPDEQD